MRAEESVAESGMPPVRVGLIGCGRHASQCIHPSLPYLPQVEVVAVCDLDESRARATAGRLGVSAVYAQTQRMLAEEQPEAVILIGPPAMQNPVGLECLEHGCHLFIDKPPGLCPADARHLAEFAAARGLMGQVGHNQRHSPAMRTARRIAASHEFGEPTTVFTKYCGAIPTEPFWGLEPLVRGLLYYQSIHPVDTSRSVLGEIQTVTAYQVQSGSVPSGEPIVVMLEFVNGTLAVLDLNTATPYFQMRTTITGSAGTSVNVVDLDRVTYLQRPEDAGPRRVEPTEPQLGIIHEVMPAVTWQVPRQYPAEKAWGYVDQLAAFAAAIRGADPGKPTLRDGYENLLALEAIARSLTTGAPVTIEEIRTDLG